MQERQGQLAKKMFGRALTPCGAVHIEHEVPIADAQAGDVYFVPEPGKEAERADLGLLDPLTREPCLLEMIQSTPGPVEVRDNIRKQLTLDHSIALDARKQGLPRPPLLRLWMLSAGRPRQVLEGYGFTPAEGWPSGVWVRSRLDSVGIVVLSELPRERSTLLLRLMGRGQVQEEAIAELMALPENAKERAIAYEPLVALRFEVAQDPNPDEEAREYVMATQETYEQWKARVKNEARTEGKAEGRAEGKAEGRAEGKAEGRAEGKAEGRAEGEVKTLAGVYEARFGAMPEPLRNVLAERVKADTSGKWVLLFATASAEEITAALRNGQSGG